MQGRIIKGISGFYYVRTDDDTVYECKAKGAFRKDKMTPLAGDMVDIEVLSEKEGTGNIILVHERKSEMIRPAVANADRAIVIFAGKTPNPNYNLLDRFLLLCGVSDIPCIICFNKTDLLSEAERDEIRHIYRNSGAEILFTSAKTGEGIDELKEALKGKLSFVSGPSGVGKSSIINKLLGENRMETGELSRKIERGKNTTRHTEIVRIMEDSYIMDTPGFTSLIVPDIEKENLRFYYPEFDKAQSLCRFTGCMHVNEPGCEIKRLLSNGGISNVRYDNYLQILDEITRKKRF